MKLSKALIADLSATIDGMDTAQTIDAMEGWHARLVILEEEVKSEIAYHAFKLDHAQQESPNANHTDKP
jgi:hypothetical protein